MVTYLKLKDGRIMVIWGENRWRKYYSAYPINEIDLAPIFRNVERVKYSNVAISSTQLPEVLNG